LPPKLHEQQILYTLPNFYHHRDQHYDSTVQVSSV